MTAQALNVKTGDRAVVCGSGEYGDGRTLTVIKRAPKNRFLLPDGQPAKGAGDDEVKWVVKLDHPAQAPLTSGKHVMWHRETIYGVVRDAWLRQITTKEEA